MGGKHKGRGTKVGRKREGKRRKASWGQALVEAMAMAVSASLQSWWVSSSFGESGLGHVQVEGGGNILGGTLREGGVQNPVLRTKSGLPYRKRKCPAQGLRLGPVLTRLHHVNFTSFSRLVHRWQ